MAPPHEGAVSAQPHSPDDSLKRARVFETQAVLLSEKIKDIKLAMVGTLGAVALLAGGGAMVVHTSLRSTRNQIDRLQHELQDTREARDARRRELSTSRSAQQQLASALSTSKAEAKSATARYEEAEQDAKSCRPKKPTPYRYQAPSTAPSHNTTIDTGCDPHDPLCGDLGV
jgi:septal ring factor EnvC (AmiA/AmiB activator)